MRPVYVSGAGVVDSKRRTETLAVELASIHAKVVTGLGRADTVLGADSRIDWPPRKCFVD